MKTLILVAIVFSVLMDFGCSTAKGSNELLQKDQGIICEYIFSYIKDVAKKEKDLKTKTGTNVTFKALLIVASLRDDLSDQYLLKFLDFYIGSAPSAFLDDLIIKRGKKILPLLNASIKHSSFCDSNIYKCGNHHSRIQELIYLIQKQNYPRMDVDNVGDPFSYIPQEKIMNQFKSFQLKIKN